MTFFKRLNFEQFDTHETYKFPTSWQPHQMNWKVLKQSVGTYKGYHQNTYMTKFLNGSSFDQFKSKHFLNPPPIIF